jgi:hypothetical protein
VSAFVLAAFLTILRGQGFQVSADVDRGRVAVGEEITYTVRAILDGDASLRTMLPAFNGFILVGRAERREDAGEATVFVLELRLRADRIGEWVVGPVRIDQGVTSVLSPEIQVAVVEPGDARRISALSPRVLRVLNNAPPPARGDVAVTLLASADSVAVGEQVDLVTAAWFPRELLSRLRRPPELRPPTVEGVYNAVQPSTAGVGASRLVSGVWYDLYVAHQVIYPLTPGELEIPGAGLAFSVPAGRQYFSDEKAYRLTSEPGRLTVTAPPAPPDGIPGGPTARDLTFRYQLSPEAATAGEPIPVDLVLSGVGNVALWPVPTIEWPEGARGYADRSVDAVAVSRGVLGGEKRFRYSVLADSAGSLALPTVRYPYYDPIRAQWLEAVARAVVLPIQPALTLRDRRTPLPILRTAPSPVAGLGTLSNGILLALLIAPPLILLLVRFGRSAWPARPRVLILPPSDRLARLVRRFVPEDDRWRADRVAEGLRDAGVDEHTSTAVATLYVDSTTSRFQTAGDEQVPDGGETAGRLVERLPRRLLLVTGIIASAIALPSNLDAQESAGDSLYRDQRFGAAAQEYLREAAAEPQAPRLWYNAGAAAYAAGNDAQAAAAWVVAHRLAPRSADITDAWRAMVLRSPDLGRAGRAAPLTPTELWVVALLAWISAWILLAMRRRLPTLLFFTLALLFALAGWGLQVWYQRPLGVVSHLASVRDAPHGLAGEVARVDELMVVRILGERPGWRLVELRNGIRGWAPANAMVETGRLDSDA